MISKQMTAAINKQINAEIYSAYLYISMSSYSTLKGLKGTANWLFIQAQEEMTHALRMYQYVNSQGGHAVMSAIDQPPSEFESLKKIFEDTLEHEKKVTAMINDLMNLAVKEKDHATEVFLQWFVNEQVEEEENANDVLARVNLAGEQGNGLFMVDNELAARMFVPPVGLIIGAK